MEGALRADALGLQLAMVVDVSWVGASQSGGASVSSGAAGLEARDDFLITSLAGAVRLPLSDRALVWAQAGVALVGAAATVRVKGDVEGDSTSRGAVPGFELGIGAERRMWGGVPFLEVRYLRTGRFALPNLDGALSGASFCAGYRFELL